LFSVGLHRFQARLAQVPDGSAGVSRVHGQVHQTAAAAEQPPAKVDYGEYIFPWAQTGLGGQDGFANEER